MGSFSSTCCISGLPITYGTPVRWLLLTQNPYWDGGFVCYSNGRWVPRTWPIRVYNDYGSIENWEEGPLLDSIMKGFELDLVEVGVGDNSFHDGNPLSVGSKTFSSIFLSPRGVAFSSMNSWNVPG